MRMEIIIPPLNCRNKPRKRPLAVHIVTPQNITEVTADMHRNALTTLGLETRRHHDCISNSSIRPECPWQRVAYSLEQNGSTISDENKTLAQEELSLLATIYKESARKKGFHEDKLNVAVIDLKIAALTGSNQDKKLEKKDFQKLVKKILETYQLDGCYNE